VGFLHILEALRSSGFRDLNGSHGVTTISVGEPLLNAVLAASVSQRGPVREVSVHPQPGDRLAVRAKLARPEFLPPINATVAIERQPDLPQNPALGLRITGLAGLLALAGPLMSIAPKLPRGLRLDGDRLTVDLRELLADRGYEDLLGLMKRVSIHSEEGRVVIELEARVN
jgi:hypothetical protein